VQYVGRWGGGVAGGVRRVVGGGGESRANWGSTRGWVRLTMGSGEYFSVGRGGSELGLLAFGEGSFAQGAVCDVAGVIA